jgi:hypothetical protein
MTLLVVLVAQLLLHHNLRDALTGFLVVVLMEDLLLVEVLVFDGVAPSGSGL